MRAPKKIEKIVIFGGAGLVGYQIARLVAKDLAPEKIVICALFEEEVKPAAEKLKKEFPNIKHVEYEYGNIFVRKDYAQTDRREISSDTNVLDTIYKDVFENINNDDDNIGQQNLMCDIIMKHKPDVVVDCVNTATGISYQDVKSSSQVVKEFRDNLNSLIKQNDEKTWEKASSGDQKSIEGLVNLAKGVKNLAYNPLESFPHLDNLRMMDLLLVSQSVPQLVRHVILLHRSLVSAGTGIYLKVGTTGTGGMGINIPYTHGEDKPSFTLMAKTAVGFAHTGLLFLLARSPGPVVKEIKPGAMIGYKKVDWRPIKKFRSPVKQMEAKKEILGKSITLRQDPATYKNEGNLQLVGIDTGENGFFTRAEFEAITYLNQMEFVTPEEIAYNVLRELTGSNTGKDVIGAIDGAVMDPSYRAGYIRQDAINAMQMMEEDKGIPSIAIGELGPPQLSKFLYETYLLQQHFNSIEELGDDSFSAKEMSEKLERFVQDSPIQKIITSLGLPILLPDGKTILRGPTIAIPESKVHATVNIGNEKDIDKWAKQGWIDLRVENMEVWKKRAKTILTAQQNSHAQGSSGYTPEIYKHKRIHTGEMVGWIFINEFDGLRVK